MKGRIVLAAGALGLIAVLAPIADAKGVVRHEAPMRWSTGGGDLGGLIVESGTMRVRATERGARMIVVTDGLREGHSYTMWTIFYNNPSACMSPPGNGFKCGFGDAYGNPAAEGSVIYGGGIAEATGEGDRFRGYVRAKESLAVTDPVGHAEWAMWRRQQMTSPIAGVGDEQVAAGTGWLTNPLGAEYQTMLLDHGPYNPEKYGESQWKTHDGGCHVGEDYQCNPDQATGWGAAFPFAGSPQ